jgi:SNF2 family DNA or RNA helicase
MSPREWAECCAFFEIDLSSLTATTLLHFPGMKSTIAPYQLQAAFLIVRQNGSNKITGGGYLADKMGLGKTLETILVILLRRLVRLAQTEVSQAQNRGDLSNHNSKDMGVGTPCPSRSRITNKSMWPFACPCEAGLSAKLNLSKGPSLLLVPAGLATNWRSEWVKHVDFNSKLNGKMDLLIEGLKSGRETNEINALGMYGVRTCYSSDINDLKASSTDENGEVTLVPARNKDHVVVLMSKSLVKGRLQTQSMEDICWSFIGIDEAHQAKNPDVGLYRYLFEQPRYTYVLFLSATPWDKSPKDLQPPIQTIQRRLHTYRPAHGKQKCAILRNKSVEIPERYEKLGAWNIDTATATWRIIINASRADEFDATADDMTKAKQDISSTMQTILNPIMIRRTEKTRWNDQPLVPMPLHEHRDIYVDLPDASLLNKLQEFAKSLEHDKLEALKASWDARKANGEHNIGERPVSITQNTWLTLIRQARFFACFPHLFDCDISNEMTLNKSILKHLATDETERGSWAYKNLDAIDKSPKIQCLKAVLDQLEEGEPFVIFSANPAESFAQYMVSSFTICSRTPINMNTSGPNTNTVRAKPSSSTQVLRRTRKMLWLSVS